MDHVTEVMNAELIDLGAVSVETQGGQFGATEPESERSPLGIAED
jgi:hypothetical protein